MSFKMYTGIQDEEYELVDSLVEEQFEIGGVTAWVYAYQGPKGNAGSTDKTKPDYETLGSKATDIGNLVWMENSQRSYSVDAISLPTVYQVQDASMDLQIPGLFLFETMDMTIPYNMMIRRLGRKLMTGDVIELANLRDAHFLDEEMDAMNRFYVVHDAFKAASGYSHTWFHHIWKVRLVPLTDSPEFKDILGDGSNEDDLKNHLSTAQKELNIMDLIVGQADSEVPFMHYDNEQINEHVEMPDPKDVLHNYLYPDEPHSNMFFVKKTKPEIYEWNNKWDKLPSNIGIHLPTDAKEDDFFFFIDMEYDEEPKLMQFDKKWIEVSVDGGRLLPKQETSSGFFVQRFKDLPMQMFSKAEDTWVDAVPGDNPKYVNNKHNTQDSRESPPPLSKVPKGDQFPMDPDENMWFLRTDVEPNVLWKFEKNIWRKFNYGGRFQWTGTDATKARLLNNREETRVASADVLKPKIDD